MSELVTDIAFLSTTLFIIAVILFSIESRDVGFWGAMRELPVIFICAGIIPVLMTVMGNGQWYYISLFMFAASTTSSMLNWCMNKWRCGKILFIENRLENWYLARNEAGAYFLASVTILLNARVSGFSNPELVITLLFCASLILNGILLMTVRWKIHFLDNGIFLRRGLVTWDEIERCYWDINPLALVIIIKRKRNYMKKIKLWILPKNRNQIEGILLEHLGENRHQSFDTSF